MFGVDMEAGEGEMHIMQTVNPDQEETSHAEDQEIDVVESETEGSRTNQPESSESLWNRIDSAVEEINHWAVFGASTLVIAGEGYRLLKTGLGGS